MDKVIIRPNTRDYLIRLIAGVREQIKNDQQEIEARKEYGDDVISGKWLDAELLCMTVEKDILGINESEVDEV